MKGKGFWTALLLPVVLVFIFTGCFGTGSSDEEAISARERPVLGTLKVTVDPEKATQDRYLNIEPVTLGASSIVPGYSYPDQIDVQDDDTNATWDPGTNTLTIDITIINKLNATLEKVRTWTGNVTGIGAYNNPQLGNADYPSQGAQPVDGWTAGICYSEWGDWSSYTNPGLEGCDTITHVNDGQNFVFQWIDPVCGKVTSTWQFTGSQENYKFYMQITGDVYPWNPDYNAAPGGADPRFDTNWYSTWYALMATLAPSDPALEGTWCNDQIKAARAKLWWDGSLHPVTPEDPRTCGTLITDPHLLPGTYFALNIGLEAADWIENAQKTFWDTYVNNPTPGADQGVGAPYLQNYAFALLYDPNVITTFDAGGQTGNGTLYPGGFVNQFTDKSNSNASVLPNHAGIGKWQIVNNFTAGSGYIASGQSPTVGATFSFFGLGAPSYTYLYVTHTPASPGAYVYIATGLPRFAGQWGFAHYDSSGNFITEGADADLDFWFGMAIMQVNAAASAGDWSYLRFDNTENNLVDPYWNNNTADNSDDLGPGGDFCYHKTNGVVNCATADPGDPNIVVYQGHEMGNPALPPGIRATWPARPSGCPYGDGSSTCGGRQYVVGVVCVQ